MHVKQTYRNSSEPLSWQLHDFKQGVLLLLVSSMMIGCTHTPNLCSLKTRMNFLAQNLLA